MRLPTRSLQRSQRSVRRTNRSFPIDRPRRRRIDRRPATMYPVSELAPVGPRERVVSLDILRGLSLCGVLMGNLLWLYTGRFVADTADSTLDTVARVAFGLVVENKAFTI